MANDDLQEQASHEILRDRARAWWTSVLVGQLDASHPVHGTDINAAVQGDTLVITGTVPTAADRDDIEAEVAHLQGSGFTTLQNDLVVSGSTEELAGLLIQTLFAVFDSAETAAFAERYLTEHAYIHPQLLLVLAPEPADDPDRLHAVLPQAYHEDGERALAAGRHVLVVTVDETEAFKTRELLDEETRSLQTFVTPPEAAHSSPAAHTAGAALGGTYGSPCVTTV